MANIDTGSLASLLSGLVTGGLGISQLTGGSAATTNAANLANPFGAQYGQYGGMIPGAIASIEANQAGATNGVIGHAINSLYDSGGFTGNLQNLLGSLSGLGGMTQQNLLPNTNAGSTTVAENASGGNLASQLANLNQNYLSNPAIQSELKTGIDTVNRGLAAEGLVGSGAQQKELMDYGNNFAAQEYNQEFSNLISGSNAAFQQNMGVTQEQAALQGQTFGQTLNADTLLTQQMEGMGGLAGQIAQLQQGALTAGGTLATNNANLLLNSGQGLLNSLEALSGATTGSPSTAGIIESGQFGNTQQAVANLGSGLNGILSGLMGNGFSSGLLGSLFSGASGGGGGLGSILSSLGSAASGTDLAGILGQFSSGGSLANIFGSSTTDLGTLTGNILGDTGSLLGGLDAGTNVGSDLAASFL